MDSCMQQSRPDTVSVDIVMQGERGDAFYSIIAIQPRSELPVLPASSTKTKILNVGSLGCSVKASPCCLSRSLNCCFSSTASCSFLGPSGRRGVPVLQTRGGISPFMTQLCCPCILKAHTQSTAFLNALTKSNLIAIQDAM